MWQIAICQAVGSKRNQGCRNQLDNDLSRSLVLSRDGFTRTRPDGWTKREYGEDYPSGAETVAAPATVNGEQRPTCHWPSADKAD